MKSKMPLLIILGGYISNLGFYFIWYYTKYYHLLYGREIPNASIIENSVVVYAITFLYLLLFLLNLFFRSFKKPWPFFSLVSIITLLTLFIVPSGYYAKYHDIFFNQKQFERAKDKIQTEENLKKEIETKLNNPIATNDAANRTIAELQAKLESERKENVKLRKQLNETIRKTKPLEEEHKTKEDVVAQAKLNKDFSKIKINSKVVKTDSDTKNQEIIFKIQIISSSTRLATNSPQFKGLKNVWEYKDSGLYKYTVGNQKDLISASALQSEFRSKGFSGAFVVAFKNRKRIPVREAQRLLN